MCRVADLCFVSGLGPAFRPGLGLGVRFKVPVKVNKNSTIYDLRYKGYGLRKACVRSQPSL